MDDSGLRFSDFKYHDSWSMSDDEDMDLDMSREGDTEVKRAQTPNNVEEEMHDCLHFRGKKYEELQLVDLDGMEFQNINEVDKFYNYYALAMGFSVRKFKMDKNAAGIVVRRQLVCSKEGVRKVQTSAKNNTVKQNTNGKQDVIGENNPKKQKCSRRTTRENCPASFIVRRCHTRGVYYATEFITEHNHQLVISEHARFLRSHRNVRDHDLAQVTALRKASVKTSQAYEYLVHQAGGYKYVGFTLKDLYNSLDSERREITLDGDAQAAISFMNLKASHDPDLAESMCFSLKKGICLRKHANEMGRNCDWERTNSFEHSLVSTLMTVGVGGTMQSHLNQEHPNSNKLLTNEEQSHLERVIFSLVDQEESNTEGDRVTIRDKNQGDAEVECYPVGSSQLEVGMPNIDYCEQPTVDVPSNQVQRRSIRNKRPGPQLLSPFACAIPYKKRKVGQYNPLLPAPRKLRDGLRQFIEKWKHSPCDDVNIVNNVVDQQFILDIIDVGAWLSNQHIDIGLHLLRKRGVDFPDMFGKNWTTVDHSFSEFVISDYNRYKDVSDMSTWSPDTRLEQYVRGLRPAFSLPWEAVDMIYVPFLVSHNHWVAIVIDMVNHSMKLYDSYVRLNTDGQMSDYIHPIAYMFPHLLNKYGLVAKGHSNTGLLTPWPVHRVDNVPQQSHDDCGVYTLKFIDCLTAKFELVNWSKYDIKSIRLRMAVEFMCGSAYL